MKTRQQDFVAIKAALRSSLCFSAEDALVAEGDSLALLRSLPTHSVSLILTDPPYHATKKQNIFGDTAFAEDQHYLEWMAEYALEWRRVLRPNGSLFCFCDSSMSARLEILFSKGFNVLSHVVWTKPNDPGFDGWKGKMKKRPYGSGMPILNESYLPKLPWREIYTDRPSRSYYETCEHRQGFQCTNLLQSSALTARLIMGGLFLIGRRGAIPQAANSTIKCALQFFRRARSRQCLSMKM